MQNAVQERIVALRRESNALVPISCLPPELLATVFERCVVDPRAPFLENMEAQKDAMTCRMRLTRVCYYWRALADRKSTRLNSSHSGESRMPSSA